MLNSLLYVFNPANFEPHGGHFINTPILFWTFIISNLVTFAAYVCIPIALVYFVRKRKDLVFRWVFLFFGLFIALCGVHHLLHVITFWYPIYGIEALNDVLLALVSIGTFFSLLPVIPVALTLRSPKELDKLNQKLSIEIEHTKKAEAELTGKNKELVAKNEELENMNKIMIGRELKMVELKKEIEELKKQHE